MKRDTKREWRFRRFGATPADFDRLFEQQRGLCAICREPIRRGTRGHDAACFDHAHDRARPRGLLCGACNPALGKMRDDPRRLVRAVDYLNHHRHGDPWKTARAAASSVASPAPTVDRGITSPATRTEAPSATAPGANDTSAPTAIWTPLEPPGDPAWPTS